MSALRFQDRVAIVTGGCVGIGKGCVDVLVEHGGKVAVFDIDDKAGKAMTGDQIFYVKCDVTNDQDVESAIATTIEKFGKLDCLVNNAGIQLDFGCVDEVTVDEFKRLLEVNLVGYYRMIRGCMPHLRKTTGSIVNISSCSNQLGSKREAAYCASKGGVAAMTRSIAIDEGKTSGVRINCISPGVIQTPMLDKALEKNPHMEEPLKNTTQMGRYGQPREVGLTCLYLAVDATYSTGSDLLMTGGFDLGFGQKM